MTTIAIPESELTPKVRAAFSALSEELLRLQCRYDEARSQLDEIRRAVDQDMLLPLLNRRALVRELGRFIDFAARYGTRASVLFIDIDGFKAINDEHGHSAGDSVLRDFCEFLTANIRNSDILGRVGGDEFAIILPGMNAAQAQKKGRSLSTRLDEAPLQWHGTAVSFSFSSGASELRADSHAEIALAEADAAMYAAKRDRAKP